MSGIVQEIGLWGSLSYYLHVGEGFYVSAWESPLLIPPPFGFPGKYIAEGTETAERLPNLCTHFLGLPV